MTTMETVRQLHLEGRYAFTCLFGPGDFACTESLWEGCRFALSGEKMLVFAGPCCANLFVIMELKLQPIGQR